MLFVTYRRIDNQAMMGTDYLSCISFDALDSQEAAGYYFKVNEKRMTAKQVKAFFKDKKDFQPALNDAVKEEVKHDVEPSTFKELRSKRKVRKIKCLNTGTIYNNMTACAKDLGMDPAAISYAMQKNKPAKGFSFEFVE